MINKQKHLGIEPKTEETKMLSYVAPRIAVNSKGYENRKKEIKEKIVEEFTDMLNSMYTKNVLLAINLQPSSLNDQMTLTKNIESSSFKEKMKGILDFIDSDYVKPILASKNGVVDFTIMSPEYMARSEVEESVKDGNVIEDKNGYLIISLLGESYKKKLEELEKAYQNPLFVEWIGNPTLKFFITTIVVRDFDIKLENSPHGRTVGFSFEQKLRGIKDLLKPDVFSNTLKKESILCEIQFFPPGSPEFRLTDKGETLTQIQHFDFDKEAVLSENITSKIIMKANLENYTNGKDTCLIQICVIHQREITLLSNFTIGIFDKKNVQSAQDKMHHMLKDVKKGKFDFIRCSASNLGSRFEYKFDYDDENSAYNEWLAFQNVNPIWFKNPEEPQLVELFASLSIKLVFPKTLDSLIKDGKIDAPDFLDKIPTA